MAKIFTTQLTELNLDAAEVLGSVIQIPVDIYRASLPASVKSDRVALIAATLDGENAESHVFNPYEDHILLIGDPVNIGLVFSLAASRAIDAGCSSLKTLRWDRQRVTYIPVEVTL